MDTAKVISAGGWCVLAALAAGCLALPARAQQQSTVSSPDTIRACLCLEQSVNRQASDVSKQRQTYEERRRQADALNSEVATRKPQVDIHDRASIEAFSQLLGQRDAAVQSLAETLTPQYASVVNAYNQRVAQYNRQCTGQSFNATVMQQVRQNLVCPQE